MNRVETFDLHAGFCQLPAHRWTAHKRRDPGRLRGVVLHSWGVPVGVTSEARMMYGEAGALARRGLRTPYCINAGATARGIGVVAWCHPVERYTYASDAGNAEWLAVSVMGRFPLFESQRTSHHSAMTPVLTAAVHDALALACKVLAEATGSAGPFPLITHRQCINGAGDHAACPGEAIVRAALGAPVVADGLLVPDPDLVLVPEFGRPWPAAWR